jgi:hypothetical protein
MTERRPHGIQRLRSGCETPNAHRARGQGLVFCPRPAQPSRKTRPLRIELPVDMQHVTDRNDRPVGIHGLTTAWWGSRGGGHVVGVRPCVLPPARTTRSCTWWGSRGGGQALRFAPCPDYPLLHGLSSSHAGTDRGGLADLLPGSRRGKRQGLTPMTRVEEGQKARPDPDDAKGKA